MSFTDEGMKRKPFLSHQLSTDGAMTDVRLCSEALDAWGVRFENANVMKHCCFLNKLLVDWQLWMSISYGNSLISYGTAMNQENASKFVVLGVISIDN